MTLSKSRKIASGAAALVAAGSLLVGGVYAAFTDTETSAPQTIATGTVNLSLADSANATPPVKFTQSISGLAAGDTSYRILTVKNVGTLNLSTLNMTAAPSAPNALTTTAAASGLGVQVESCNVAWTIGSPTTAPTCTGGSTNLHASTNIAGLSTATALPASSLTAGNNAYLMFKYTLDATAADTLQGLSTDVTYTFVGTQRTGAITTQ